MSVKVGLPPIARPNARLFILGSLPGDVSLAEQRYYAHPTNQFWRLLGGAIGEDLQGLDYQGRLERLGKRRIALWDVIASASRQGSLDQAIRDVSHNALAELLHAHSHLEAIAFNGGTASRAGRRLIGLHSGLELIDLPSSSAANTRPVTEKASAWARLRKFID